MEPGLVVSVCVCVDLCVCWVGPNWTFEFGHDKLNRGEERIDGGANFLRDLECDVTPW
jgi:hypothetical protein